MISRDPSASGDDLAERLLSQIHERVQGRVRDLVADRRHGRVVVRGKADSYYAWQLALAACQQVLAGRRDLSLDCRLDVAPTPRARAERDVA